MGLRVHVLNKCRPTRAVYLSWKIEKSNLLLSIITHRYKQFKRNKLKFLINPKLSPSQKLSPS
eukprot:scaffold2294_cov194-Ochromonas_danica.AAC.2